MKLIVGLGNPGKEYENTRHNIGFMAIDKYLGDQAKYKTKNNGEYFIDNVSNTIYLKPLSYMNESGRVIKKYVEYYKIDLDDILVIYDDMDFDFGTFKIKSDGNSAGHNGFKSIIDCLGTNNIKRIRVGISRPKYDKIDYVLGKFSKNDLEILNKTLDQISLVISDYLIIDFEKLMNKYN